MVRALTPELIAATQRGLQRLFLSLYEAAPVGPWETLFTRVSSASAGENYPALGAVPQVAAFTGTRVYSGLRTDGFYVTNENYDAAIEIPREDIERDSLGKYSAALAEMAASAKTVMVSLLATILANGTSTSLARCWDGKSLFSATHGKDKASAQSNIVTGSGVDTLAHVQTDIAKCIAAAQTWKNDKGAYVRGIDLNTALYPASNYALGLLLDTIRANRTDLGTANQSMYLQQVIPVPELSGNDWYLAAGGGALRPFLWQEEKAPTPETTFDFDRKTMKMAVELRGAAACADWMRIVQVDNS